MASGWKVAYAGEASLAEMSAMPEDIRSRFERISALIMELGLPRVRKPYVKHLDGKLWEMRMKGKDGIARSIYVALEPKTVVVLHSFIKKTQRTPKDALRIARARLQELSK